MANLPRAVQAQLEQADAILAGGSRTDDQPAQPAEPVAQEPAQQVEPQAQETAPAPQPPTPAQPPSVDYEHKFKTLQGIFNAEVPKLQQQNKELSARLQDALERMEKLAQQSKAPDAPQQPTLDPKDVENFGQDLVDMVQRQTQAVLGRVAGKIDAVVADFEKRISQMEQALKGTTQTVAMTAEEVFFNKLTTLVPDWEQINGNEQFLAWLAETDPVYGQPRQAALTAAQNAMDVNRVANVFKAFKALLPQQPKTDPLAKQVSPKSAAAAAPQAPSEKPVITQKQVQAFYHEVATGKYRGREAEAQRLEQMINEAMAEGRIR